MAEVNFVFCSDKYIASRRGLFSGHTYGAGAFLALAHDYRVMNNEKGWFCLNEVHIGLNISPFLQELTG